MVKQFKIGKLYKVVSGGLWAFILIGPESRWQNELKNIPIQLGDIFLIVERINELSWKVLFKDIVGTMFVDYKFTEVLTFGSELEEL
jgi:hypothetical protein